MYWFICNAADGVFILGSTEPHYTPSKPYQGVLSGKPILAVLHKESTAVNVIKESGVRYSFDLSMARRHKKFQIEFCGFINIL